MKVRLWVDLIYHQFVPIQNLKLRKPLYAEDNQAMGNTHDPILSTYKRQYPYHYDYYQNPIYYGYYDDYGYWHNYTDDWGYPMYWYNGGFYYY